MFIGKEIKEVLGWVDCFVQAVTDKLKELSPIARTETLVSGVAVLNPDAQTNKEECIYHVTVEGDYMTAVGIWQVLGQMIEENTGASPEEIIRIMDNEAILVNLSKEEMK